MIKDYLDFFVGKEARAGFVRLALPLLYFTALLVFLIGLVEMGR